MIEYGSTLLASMVDECIIFYLHHKRLSLVLGTKSRYVDYLVFGNFTLFEICESFRVKVVEFQGYF